MIDPKELLEKLKELLDNAVENEEDISVESETEVRNEVIEQLISSSEPDKRAKGRLLSTTVFDNIRDWVMAEFELNTSPGTIAIPLTELLASIITTTIILGKRRGWEVKDETKFVTDLSKLFEVQLRDGARRRNGNV